MSATIQTYSGLLFTLPPDRSTLGLIRIEDIAHALSLTCRFCGHCTRHYSVAQHSVLVARRAEHLTRVLGLPKNVSARVVRNALLHDGSEAYLQDVPGPLKSLPAFSGYLRIERLLQDQIELKYSASLNESQRAIVKRADRELLAVERREVMVKSDVDWGLEYAPPDGITIDEITPEQAKKMFLDKARELKIK